MRTVLRWLDPWVASLLGVLVALAVVILLATPGPWHVVGEKPRVQVTPHRPSDIAVFVLGSGVPRCTAVIWLHADYDKPSLTASLVASATQGLVPGGGYARVDRLVTDASPAVATQALGQALGVPMDAWAVLDRKALREAVPGMFPVGDQHAQRREYRKASAAWAGDGGTDSSWRRQYDTLSAALPFAAYKDLSVVAFSNYVLGFGYVQSDLDLQGAASLGQLVQGLTAGRVRVRAVPAVVETCRSAQTWRVDTASLAQLRGSLVFGVVPPRIPPTVRPRRVTGSVLVTGAPGGAAGQAYLAQLRIALRASAGAPVAVSSVPQAPGEPLAAAVDRALDAGRPAAVIVAGALVPAPGSEDQTAADLGDVAAVLRQRNQPAVVCSPALPQEASQAALTAAIARTRLPVAPPPPALAGGPATSPPSPAPSSSPAPLVWDARAARLSARATAATVARACWPGALSPDLPSTTLGFSFASARAAKVVVVGDAAVAARLTGRLALYGWQASPRAASSWKPPLVVRAVYYHDGQRRAALALAGDLGLSPALAVLDPSAPAPVTVGLATPQ